MSGALRVEPLGASADAEYCAFLDGLAGSSGRVLAYHYPFYREMLQRSLVGDPYYWGAWRDGRLVAALPGFVRHSDVGSVYSSLPYFGPNAGVLCRDEDEVTAGGALLAAVVSRLRDDPRMLSASFYTPFLCERFAVYDAALPAAIVIPRETLYIEVRDWQIDSNLAYDIRKADKSGVTVETEPTPERVEAFYEIYAQNCRDNGSPQKPRAAVEALLGDGLREGHATISFALREGRVIGGLLILWSPATASYYIPCTRSDARSQQPGTLLIQRALEIAAQRDVRFWNWEASPSRDSGVYMFKKKWGSTHSPFRVYVLALRMAEAFRALGRERLTAEFPYFFVYPFDRL